MSNYTRRNIARRRRSASLAFAAVAGALALGVIGVGVASAAGPSTTTITSISPAPGLTGNPFTVFVSVTGGVTPSGTVTVSDGTQFCLAPLDPSGNGNCNLTESTAGTYNITASYPGDVNNNPSATASPTGEVVQSPTTTTITGFNPTPTQGVPSTVTVQVTSNAGPTPTGSVDVVNEFLVTLCTAPLVGGMGSCQATYTVVGSEDIFARYSGDTLNANSNTSGGTPVNVLNSTTTTISSVSPAPVAGAPFTVGVSVASAGPTPTGSVVAVDGLLSCSATLDGSGNGSCQITDPSAGPHNVTATYQGDSNDGPSSTAAPTPVVLAKAPTTTTITHVATGALAGQPFSVSASVASPGLTTTSGTVVISDGSHSCSGTLSSGATSCSLTEPGAGSFALTATYQGDANNVGSTSAPASVVVGSPPTPAPTPTPSPPSHPNVPAPVQPSTPRTSTTTTTSPTTTTTTTTPPAPVPPGALGATPPSGGQRAPVSQNYSPLADAQRVVHLEVAIFALLGIAAAGGAVAVTTGVLGGSGGEGAGALGGAAVGAGEAGDADEVDARDVTKGRKSASLASAKVKHHNTTESTASGDRSRTWRLPWTHHVDQASRSLPAFVAPVAPLLARLGTDGQYLRAMVGSGSIAPVVAGGVLAALAVANVHGRAAPPATWLLGAMIALSILDAVAGFLACIVFTLGILVSGGLGSADSLRTVLGLGIIMFAIPLLAGATRPLRRPSPSSLTAWWDRGGDVIIASLVGAWAVAKMVQALPGLSGHVQPIVADADVLAAVALGAVALRFVLETVAVSWYPARLVEVECDAIGPPARGQELASLALRTALFVFIAYAFLGNCWELWVGAVLFVLPQVLKMIEDRFPNSATLFRFIPTKVLKTVIMLVVGALWAGFVFGRIHDPRKLIGYSFILLSLPGLLQSTAELFGRKGKGWPKNWTVRALGAGIVVTGVLLATGTVTVP